MHYFCDCNVVTSHYRRSTVRQKGKNLIFFYIKHTPLSYPSPAPSESGFQHISVTILDLTGILEELDLPDEKLGAGGSSSIHSKCGNREKKNCHTA